MNKYERIPEEVIDLHGFTTKEAEQMLIELITRTDVRHVRIIVGKGTHSPRGPVLRDFVTRYLTLRGIKFMRSKINQGGEGAIEVFL